MFHLSENRLRELRKEKGLTLKELSQQLKDKGTPLSASSLIKYERGERNPKLETWANLAAFFDVSISYLQGLTNDPEPIFDGIENLDLQADLENFNDLLKKNGKKNKLSELLEKVNELPIEQGASVASTFNMFITSFIIMIDEKNTFGIISELDNLLGIIPVVQKMEGSTDKVNKEIERIIRIATSEIARINSDDLKEKS